MFTIFQYLTSCTFMQLSVYGIIMSPILLTNKIHMEVSSAPFNLLMNSPYLVILSGGLFLLSLSVCNLYYYKSIYFSFSNLLVLFIIFMTIVIQFHMWFKDLVRELAKKYESLLMSLFMVFFIFVMSEALLFISFFWASFHSTISPTLGMSFLEGLSMADPCELTFANTLLLSNAAVSLCGAFVSIEISTSYAIFFSAIAFVLAIMFASLQIKEFRTFSTCINDSVYSSVFFFLTGLHFSHVAVGLIITCIFFWTSSFGTKTSLFYNHRSSEIHLFYNLQLFYWHFVEVLWLFIFLVFYRY